MFDLDVTDSPSTNKPQFGIIPFYLKKELCVANADLIEFGHRLKVLRLRNKLSQESLGLISGLDRTYISGIERGVGNVGLANIYRLARAMNIPVADLFSEGLTQ